MSNPTSLSRLPSRSGESSGERRQAGLPRRLFSFSYDAPLGDLALIVERKKGVSRVEVEGRGSRVE